MPSRPRVTSVGDLPASSDSALQLVPQTLGSLPFVLYLSFSLQKRIGRLRPMVERCLATLIMYWPERMQAEEMLRHSFLHGCNAMLHWCIVSQIATWV